MGLYNVNDKQPTKYMLKKCLHSVYKFIVLLLYYCIVREILMPTLNTYHVWPYSPIVSIAIPNTKYFLLAIFSSECRIYNPPKSKRSPLRVTKCKQMSES